MDKCHCFESRVMKDDEGDIFCATCGNPIEENHVFLKDRIDLFCTENKSLEKPIQSIIQQNDGFGWCDCFHAVIDYEIEDWENGIKGFYFCRLCEMAICGEETRGTRAEQVISILETLNNEQAQELILRIKEHIEQEESRVL